MKTRTLVAAIAIPLLILLIFLAPLWAFAIAVGIISSAAAWEFLRCTDPSSPMRFRVYASVVAFAIPIGSAFLRGNTVLTTGLFLLCALMFTELMLSFRKEKPLSMEALLLVVFAGAIMPMLLSAMVRVGLRENSSVYLLLPFVAAFSSDSGAYFAGSFLGKHKAFPHLSPNKTVEGCIGGFVAAILIMLLYGLILLALGFEVNFLLLALYGLLGSLACQIGDLSFSAVKRLYGVKDYGHLIPGHGGMLDRFDSMHLTAPML
ncbi:MAG: phosphatidate cytidylyltransferase, partial [Oscillospiraceae bacterium]